MPEKGKAIRTEFRCATSAGSERLDKALSRLSGTLTRSAAARLVSTGLVFVNGEKQTDKSFSVMAGDWITVVTQEEPDRSPELRPVPLALDIVYEDDDLLVLIKEQGMLVHSTGKGEEPTLVQGLLYRYGEELKGVGEKGRPGIVHRLDRGTGGLLVCAKTEEAYKGLRRIFDRHDVTRTYRALCYNCPRENEGLIDKPIGRTGVGIKRTIGGKDSREALTQYRVLRKIGAYSLIETTLFTGRTHQIRVHMASIGCPVVGDPVYGPRRDKFHLHGQALYANRLAFLHPVTGEALSFQCDDPVWFQEAVRKAEHLSASKG